MYVPSNEVLIVETALHSFLLNVPRAAAIWLVMLIVAVFAVVALSRSGVRVAAEPDVADPDPTRPDPIRPDPIRPNSIRPDPTRRHPARTDGAQAEEALSNPRAGRAAPVADDRDWAHRYADEVAVAAERAAATAQRRRAEWERAQDAVDEAWAAFDAADRAVRRTAAAAALPVFDDARTPAEYADRERFLHRSATAACRRHELSIHELNDVLAHRNGWDPTRHPVHQEAALCKAVRDRQFMAYREATTRERQAWHTAGVAAAALRSLREEAAAARLRLNEHVPTPGQLWWAEQWSTAEPAVGDPAVTDEVRPATGHPATDHPATDHPVSGHPATDHRATGHRVSAPVRQAPTSVVGAQLATR